MKHMMNQAKKHLGDLEVVDLTVEEIKAKLYAHNEWFYQCLNGQISIGKLIESIAQTIVEERERKRNEV